MNQHCLQTIGLIFIWLQVTFLWGNDLKSNEATSPHLLQSEPSERVTVEGNSITVTSQQGGTFSTQLRHNHSLSMEKALEFSVQLDPVKNDDGATADIDAGIVLGMSSPESNPDRYDSTDNKVLLELKEFADRYRFTIILDGQTISFWGRQRSEHGIPNIGTRQASQSYFLKIVAIPRGDQTGLRFFVEHGDRPLRLFKYADPEAKTEYGEFVTEWRLKRPLTENNYLGLYTRENGRAQRPVETTFSDIKVRTISIDDAEAWMSAEEFVMANLNYDHPTMTDVKAARDAGDMEQAKARLIDYFRTRQSPTGPDYDREMARATSHGKEANWREVSDNAIDGIYAKLSWFHGFSNPGELCRNNGLPRWDRDPGFLTRHYHWVVMTHAWNRTGEEKYAKRLAEEVIDYVQQEPTVFYNNPNLGGQLDVIDGSVINEHMLWTGNIGRRLELTWWQMFEVMRKSEAFSDEAIFHYLDGVIRQCRLLTNPTIFQEWDDSGFHGAMALTKSSMLFEMCDEAPLWSRIGWERINKVMDVQFHPDGSHVSLSSGYAWATIKGLEDFYLYVKKSGGTVPKKMEQLISEMYYHPLALTRPDFGNVDLNDGGWSPITHLANEAYEIFPERLDYQFFATGGKEGESPKSPSMYFPNAGHYVFRTGWGSDEKYLFFGAGPWGASHGKMDALNIYAAYGPHLLLQNAGRGAYSGVGNTIHAGKSLSFNVLSPDWAQENSIPHWKQEKAIGFNPPERRFKNDEYFGYGEGSFTYGWHKPGMHYQGKWVRQVIFMKGTDPKLTGYYVVIDTVEPADNRPTTWRHPWQLAAANPVFSQIDNSFRAVGGGVAMQVLPVDPDNNMSVRVIRGQEKPELLGWRVYGETADPWNVPTYEWQAENTFTKAWIIQMQSDKNDWPVQSVHVSSSVNPGEIKFEVRRSDGGMDSILRRTPGSKQTPFRGEEISGDVAVVSQDREGHEYARLEMTGGDNSVAASRGIPVTQYQPNISERFAKVRTSRLGDSPIGLDNASFEQPMIEKPSGTIEGWDSNSLNGTGTWPADQVGVKGEPNGNQVVAIHQGGFIGQILKDERGQPIAIAPGKTIRIHFHNFPHQDHRPINMGVYLHAGEGTAPQVAKAYSFSDDENNLGDQSAELTISSAETLSSYLPKGWENIPLYLKFHNYSGRIVIDDVQVKVVK
ncbi:heparinase II/III family protein [Rubinisphaera italica]|uniref:Heparin-sulfate lyase n=1 Tax=Rubinisphaera italica TaxID=2527969 RepID=A0A5C5XIS5_9PLAN|nr:heparinase II/III family protein [Rubinisphaera italica]TWT61742.1 Heparin-sulfate lyase precursor [Rubinisphaera italica]